MSGSNTALSSNDFDSINFTSSLDQLAILTRNRERDHANIEINYQLRNIRNNDYTSPALHESYHNELSFNGHSLVATTPSTTVSNLPNSEHWHNLQPRMAIINHARSRINNSRDLLFDFFGGGDSPKSTIEYYRRRVANDVSTESALR